MFTVVLAEQEHLDNIQEYKSFLQPFLNSSELALCCWQRNGSTLEEAIPSLYETVSRHERWRLLVVCPEDGISQKNPFDIVKHTDPPRDWNVSDEEYRQLRREARLASYRAAANQSLTRLMTWLCQRPMVSQGKNNAHTLDPEFGEFLAQAQEKEALRNQILGDFVCQVTLPTEILCVAKRCYHQDEYDIRTSWTTHQETLYSRFYDYNLYFDKMRYLVFDILPKSHRNYTFDYIRFLYTLMLMADNAVPLGTLSPDRVYCLECKNDEQALQNLLGDYDNKLTATLEQLKCQERKLRSQTQPRLDDRDAKAIFCSNVTVPVTTAQEFDQSTLYVTRDRLGLAKDCPGQEDNAWEDAYYESRRAMGRFLKSPRRVLRKTSADVHRMNVADLDQADRLNEYQLEDVAEYVAEEELKMVSTPTCDLYDISRYTKAQEAQDKRIHTIIERRMTRKWTITIGVAALVCYLIGFLPMFLSNLSTGDGTLFSLVFFAAGGGVMALSAFVTLFFLRHPLWRAYSDYNGIMKGIVNDVEGSMAQYSKYLSHACNVMRGNSVLNYCENRENPNSRKLRVLKKHEMDILAVREEMREIFSQFLPKQTRDVDVEDAYPYDFTRAVDFAYPIPFSAKGRSHVEFLQPGNLVEAPVGFIKAIHARREELYD